MCWAGQFSFIRSLPLLHCCHLVSHVFPVGQDLSLLRRGAESSPHVFFSANPSCPAFVCAEMALRWLCKKQVRSLSCCGRAGRVVWGVPSVPACATSLVKDWHLALASTACGASRPGSAVVTLVLGPAGLLLWGSRGTELCHQPRAGCVPTLAMRGCVNRSWEINGCKPGPGPRAWIKIKH